MKCKITLGDVMEIKQDKRRFDFHDIGLAIKRAREASGMTQEQLAYDEKELKIVEATIQAMKAAKETEEA